MSEEEEKEVTLKETVFSILKERFLYRYEQSKDYLNQRFGLDKLIYFIKEGLNVFVYPVKTYRFMRGLLRNGYHRLDSEFTFRNETLRFSTVIQPDADIMMFIPRPNLYDDDEWYETFRTKFEEHKAAVYIFFESFKNNHVFWSRSFDTALVGINLYPIYDFLMHFDWENFWEFAITSIGSYILRTYLKKQALGLIMKGLWAILKLYLKKKYNVTSFGL